MILALPGRHAHQRGQYDLGAGQVGAGQTTLINEGTIIATGTHALTIDTGTNVVTNSGTLEATGSGGLVMDSDDSNQG